MATITSNTGSGLIHPSYNWEDSTSWQGGVVPNSGDTVYIEGYRTAINQTQIGAWTIGTINITVTSTSNFPAVGYFYTYTTRSKKVKIDYVSKTTTVFSGCTIDQNYSKFDNSDLLSDGFIANASYVYSPAPYIKINSNITGSTTLCTIRYGGILQINSGGTFELKGEYVDVVGGSLLLEDGATFKYMRHNALCRIIGDSEATSTIIMRGNEVRLNSVLNNDLNINDTKIPFINGFVIGDKISIYKKPTDGNIPSTFVDFRLNYTCNRLGISGSTYDEGFDICGLDESYIHLKLRNGIEGVILSATTYNNIATLIIDEQRFNAGDIINYNIYGTSQGYTIQSVEDYDYLLRDYDFANGATLDDWTTDTGVTTYYANFSTDGAKLKHLTTSANNIFIKDLWIKNVKVEAWMSPLDNITSGSISANPFYLCIENDPVMDKNALCSNLPSKCTAFIVDETNNWVYLSKRYLSGSNGHNTANIPSNINLLNLGSQLITNPSAVIDLTNWTNSGDATKIRITDDGPIGTYSIESTTYSGTTTNYLAYTITTTAGYIYSLEFYAKSISGNTNLTIFNISTQYMYLTNTWSKYKINFESGSSGTIRFCLSSSGTFRISELSLFQIYSGVTQLDCRTLAKYTLENRNGFLKAYINDNQIFEALNRNDSYYGTVGIYTNNEKFTCTRFKVYSTCQKITINTNDTFLSGNTICQSGAEYYHNSGQTVLKIGSIITNAAGHTDLAFGYQGKNNGYYPTIRGVNSNLNATAGVSSPFILNHDIKRDNYLDIGTGSNKYVVIDLMRNVYFTHISLIQYYDISLANTTITGIAISGSTDGSTWSEIYTKVADNRLSNVAACLRFYNCNLQYFRYVKVLLDGNSVTTSNLLVNVGVHDFSSGYTLTLNNTSDLNTGDRISIYPKYTSGYGEYTETGFYTNIVTNKTKNPSDYLSGLMEYYTIIGKTGNTISLERPYVKSYLEGDGKEIVIKVNRNTKIIGKIAQNEYYKGTLQLTNGFYYARKYIFENCEFIHHGSNQWGANTETCGVSNQNTDPYNPVILNGLSYHSGYNGYTYAFHGYYGYFNVKNSYITNINYIRHSQYNYNTYIINTNNFYLDIFTFYHTGAIKSIQYNYNYNLRNSNVYLEVNFYHDYMTSINLIEFNRNYNTAIYLNGSYFLNQKNKNFKIGNNYMTNNDYVNNGYYQPFLINNFTFNSEHLGLRTTPIATTDGPMIKSLNQSINGRMFYYKNYNRWNYDLISFYYGFIVKFPNTNYVRYYPYSSSFLTTLFGIDFYLLEQSDLNISIKFDYRLSKDQYYLYSTTYTYQGALTLFLLFNGVVIDTIIITKSMDWYEYVYNKNIQNAESGRYAIVFNISQIDGYVDVRNSQGNVNSNKGKDNIFIYSNTVDSIDLMFNPIKYASTQQIYPLTTDNSKKIIFAGRKII